MIHLTGVALFWRFTQPGDLRYTDTQSVATQRGLPIAPSHGLSGRQFASAIIAALRVLRTLRRP